MRFTTLYRPMTALLFTALTATAAIAQQAQRNLAQEEANRQLVVEFYHQNFNQHQVDQATKVMADDYIQHNPLVPNGKAPFVSFFKGFFVFNFLRTCIQKSKNQKERKVGFHGVIIFKICIHLLLGFLPSFCFGIGRFFVSILFHYHYILF